jgi:hypothetical protein
VTRALALAALLALSGCGVPPVVLGAAIGAGATLGASWTRADVTVLGWYLCKRGNRAACGVVAQP